MISKKNIILTFNFTIFSNGIMRLKGIEPDAFFMYCYLLMNAEAWNVSKPYIHRTYNMNERRIEKALKTLEQLQLVERRQKRDERTGLFLEVEYIVTNDPQGLYVAQNIESTDIESGADNALTDKPIDDTKTEDIDQEIENSTENADSLPLCKNRIPDNREAVSDPLTSNNNKYNQKSDHSVVVVETDNNDESIEIEVSESAQPKNQTEKKNEFTEQEEAYCGQVMELWRSHADNFGKAILTRKRMHMILALSKRFSLEDFAACFTTANQSEYMLGKGEDRWRASFEWIIRNEDHFFNTMEGKYIGIRKDSQKKSGVNAQHTEKYTQHSGRTIYDILCEQMGGVLQQ